MRQWLLAMGIGMSACAPALAGSASAGLAVSVTVADQCVIRTDSRSASCAGGSAYVMGVRRERIVFTDDRLAIAGEYARAADHGSRIGTSRSVAGADDQQAIVLANGAVRTVAPMDAIRVTYSF